MRLASTLVVVVNTPAATTLRCALDGLGSCVRFGAGILVVGTTKGVCGRGFKPGGPMLVGLISTPAKSNPGDRPSRLNPTSLSATIDSTPALIWLRSKGVLPPACAIP